MKPAAKLKSKQFAIVFGMALALTACVPALFVVPVFEEIPMQTILHLSNGEIRAYFDTKSFSRATMKAQDFAVPSGLSYTSQLAEMIYGKEMEGVADLLPDP